MNHDEASRSDRFSSFPKQRRGQGRRARRHFIRRWQVKPRCALCVFCSRRFEMIDSPFVDRAHVCRDCILNRHEVIAESRRRAA